MKYFSRQLSYKRKVSLQEQNVELDGFPQVGNWFRIVNMRKEVIEVCAVLCVVSETSHTQTPPHR